MFSKVSPWDSALTVHTHTQSAFSQKSVREYSALSVCVCVFMCICVRVCVCMHIHTYTCIHMHTHTHILSTLSISSLLETSDTHTYPHHTSAPYIFTTQEHSKYYFSEFMPAWTKQRLRPLEAANPPLHKETDRRHPPKSHRAAEALSAVASGHGTQLAPASAAGDHQGPRSACMDPPPPIAPAAPQFRRLLYEAPCQ